MLTAGQDVERQKFALKELFASYNRADPDVIETQLEKLLSRISWATREDGESAELVDKVCVLDQTTPYAAILLIVLHALCNAVQA